MITRNPNKYFKTIDKGLVMQRKSIKTPSMPYLRYVNVFLYGYDLMIFILNSVYLWRVSKMRKLSFLGQELDLKDV